MCSCLEAAKYFISLQGYDAGDAISNLKLQKLMYYAQGFYLALHDKPLFKEDFEAWEHGPVIPFLYQLYRSCGSGALPRDDYFDPDTYSPEDKKFLNDIYDTFGQYSAWALRELSHQTPPWYNTPRNMVIPKDVIKTYFKTQLE